MRFAEMDYEPITVTRTDAGISIDKAPDVIAISKELLETCEGDFLTVHEGTNRFTLHTQNLGDVSYDLLPHGPSANAMYARRKA